MDLYFYVNSLFKRKLSFCFSYFKSSWNYVSGSAEVDLNKDSDSACFDEISCYRLTEDEKRYIISSVTKNLKY